MAQVKLLVNKFRNFWHHNVTNRYEPSKHYFRGKLSKFHKEQN